MALGVLANGVLGVLGVSGGHNFLSVLNGNLPNGPMTDGRPCLN